MKSSFVKAVAYCCVLFLAAETSYAASVGYRYQHQEVYLDENARQKAFDAKSVLPPLDPPTEADLAETTDIVFTDEFKIIANALGNDPVDLYNFVHDEIDFDNYFGSLKGSHGCMMEASGNDVDQASLLIALLRYHGIPARYQFGTLRLSYEQAEMLVGMDFDIVTGESLYFIVGQAFSSLGYPAASILGNVPGEPADPMFLHIDMVWVRAYVPVTNYRGRSGNETEYDWVYLAPHIKRYTIEPAPTNILGAVSFEPSAFISEATIGELPIDYYKKKVSAYVQQQGIQCPTLKSLMRKKEIVNDQWEVLPDTLPAQVVINPAGGIQAPVTWTEIPPEFRHQLRVVSEYDLLEGFPETDISKTLDCPQIYGKKVAFEWSGGGKADQKAIDDAGGISKVPAGLLLDVAASLTVDDVPVAAGGGLPRGTAMTLFVYQRVPNLPTSTSAPVGRRTATMAELENEYSGFNAGSDCALALAINRVPDEVYGKMVEKLGNLKTSGAPASRVRNQELSILGHQYLREYLAGSDDAAGLYHSNFFHIWFVIQAVDLLTEPDPIWGGGGEYNGTRVDFTSTVSPHPINGDEEYTDEVIELSGWVGSTLEAKIIEMFQNEDSVSTATLLQRANYAGMPIYYIDSTNVDTILPLLNLDATVEQNIQNHISAYTGRPDYEPFVLAHRDTITVNRWSGAGYLTGNALDGTGMYLINGGWQ